MKPIISMNNPFIQMKQISFIFLLLVFGCQSRQGSQDESHSETTPKESNEMVTIVTEVMDFAGPDSIPSGWTTFQFINNSEDTHFMVLEKLPEGKTLEDSKNEIVPLFTEAMDLINAGNAEEGFKVFEKLPEWFFEVVFSGGPGLIAPFSVSETTLFMEPGYYVMECYLKMPQGQFHSAMGMIDSIVVTDSPNENEKPEATHSITLSSEKGIVREDSLTAGKHTIAVYFEDQIGHENFVGHDLHLVKIEDNADIAVLEKWMDWTDPDAFKSPIPEGFRFMGGTQEMPANQTAYFNVTLIPGTYAFIAEVPRASEKNMLSVFTIE
ncbi:hypothetical protein [Aquiflexum sp.]|uniref:hypothetical protein n=1 Tax=Aquiflexum sp. TaxID=1872584 RepID=UPI003593A0FF